MPGHCKICERWPHHNPGCPNEKKPSKDTKKILRKKLAEAKEKLHSQKAQYVADRKSGAKASAEMREVIIRQRTELEQAATGLEPEWRRMIEAPRDGKPIKLLVVVTAHWEATRREAPSGWLFTERQDTLGWKQLPEDEGE